MAKKTTVTPRFKKPHPPNFIREWREFRNLTQKDLADRVFMTESSISQIENRKQGYSDTTLYAVAEALRCSPGDLLTRNPMDESAPWSVLS